MPDGENSGNGSILHRLRDNLFFFATFLRHPTQLGAPACSSKRIASVVREELTRHGCRRVVELGAGLGSLTEGILQAIGPEESPLCVEKQAKFCDRLRDRFGSQINVVRGDALALPEIVAGTRWEHPDAVVCSVPLLGDFAMRLTGTIADFLPEEAVYLQLANFQRPVARHFDVKRSYWFLRNLPPERLHCAVHRSNNERGKGSVA